MEQESDLAPFIAEETDLLEWAASASMSIIQLQGARIALGLSKLTLALMEWGTGGQPPREQAYATITKMDRDWLERRRISLEDAVLWRNGYALAWRDNPKNLTARCRADLFQHAVALLVD